MEHYKSLVGPLVNKMDKSVDMMAGGVTLAATKIITNAALG